VVLREAAVSDEQRVRTMAGWIGVEISRSRVRTPGKAGYGLYRVRGSVAHRTLAELAGLSAGAVTEDGKAERGPWTAYAFTLRAILAAVEAAIECGQPNGPATMRIAGQMEFGPVTAAVPTRWTSAYRGRRDLGVSGSAELGRRSAVGEVLGGTVRQRQRAANAKFQAEHLRRRAYGLKRRYEAKGRRSADLPERSAGGRTGPSEG
jgi:hypothetical protein